MKNHSSLTRIDYIEKKNNGSKSRIEIQALVGYSTVPPNSKCAGSNSGYPATRSEARMLRRHLTMLWSLASLRTYLPTLGVDLDVNQATYDLRTSY